MENKLKFRLVLKKNINIYQVQYSDMYGEWHLDCMCRVFTTSGEPMDKINRPGFGTINERILLEMDYLQSLGYEFIGIEQE